MKFSLISATSIIAVFAAAVGPSAVRPAQAGVVNAAPGTLNIYDLVHDGETSADGGDSTVTKQDPLITATVALEATTDSWLTAGFAGRADPDTATGNGVHSTPLGAAPGTKPIADFASSLAGTETWDIAQKARAMGESRLASLIGTVGNGPATNDKSGRTVFVAAGSPIGFNDGGAAGGPGSSVAYSTAAGASGTATITVAAAGYLSRQPRAGGGYVAAYNSLQVAPQVDSGNVETSALSDTAPTTLGYNYAPVVDPAAKTKLISAVFSDSVTATGTFALLDGPGARAGTQTSQLQPGNGNVPGGQFGLAQNQPGQSVYGKMQVSQLQGGPVQPGPAGGIQTSQNQLNQGPSANGKVQTSQVQDGQGPRGLVPATGPTANFSVLIDISKTILGSGEDTQIDGTRSFISASVSANPAAGAARYMSNLVTAARTNIVSQSIEAFLVAPVTGQKVASNVPTTVVDPLHGKVMASAGALNNSLALP